MGHDYSHDFMDIRYTANMRLLLTPSVPWLITMLSTGFWVIKDSYILGDPEVTASLYYNFAYLYHGIYLRLLSGSPSMSNFFYPVNAVTCYLTWFKTSWTYNIR